MAVGATLKLQPLKPQLSISARGMATLALHIAVLSRQLKSRLRVIEFLRVEAGRLPVRRVVALRAVTAKAALVLVFMTGAAGGRKPHPGVVQIL